MGGTWNMTIVSIEENGHPWPMRFPLLLQASRRAESMQKRVSARLPERNGDVDSACERNGSGWRVRQRPKPVRR
jgi:hypothetical protein